jgi:UDP-2-acetamido-2,6-beta-L-arabino-hexul-4-ose reductase
MKIGITGADGLLGFHLRAFLQSHPEVEVRLANRQTFADGDVLDDFVRDLDGLAHLAGMNRGDEGEVERTNVMLAETLKASLDRTGAQPTIVYANSTHIDRDTGYGRGKRAAAQLLGGWAATNGAQFCDLVLPNVFGEFGKPFYNSVVSTFCHQLANGGEPAIQVDGLIELVHAQAVARRVMAALQGGEAGQSRMNGTAIRVSALLERTRGLHRQYLAQVMPDLADPFDLGLFNTLRSYMFPGHYPVALDLRADARGSLFEAVKTRTGGQTFMSSTHPGITRGNHYHLRKVERFLVVAGDAEIRLRRLFDGRIETFRVSGSRPCYIDMPTFHTHSITNVGNGELMTLFWANEIFDPNDPDTYSEAVLP